MAEPENKKEEVKPDASKMSAFSDQRDDLVSALDMLFIYGNASGRNKFREKWPDVASYIFGEQLISFDNDGTTDFDLRKKLEEEADARRFFLKETIEEMVEKSVDSGTLQFDYVGKVVDAFGPLISVFLYSETVIDRVRPGVLAKARSSDASAIDAGGDEGVSLAEKAALTSSDDQVSLEEGASESSDDFDTVQPIDTSVPEDNFSDDLIAPQGGEDDMQDVADLSLDAAAEKLSEEETSHEKSFSEMGSNPAPPIGGSLEPPPSAESIAAAKEKAERDKLPERPEEIAKPWAKLKEKQTIVQSKPATSTDEPDVPSSQPVEDAVSAPVPKEPEVNPAPPVDAKADAVSAPDASSLEESSEAQPPQPDEALPQQEGPQAEGSQSPKPPEDKTEEQLAESKVDTVSFAGRE